MMRLSEQGLKDASDWKRKGYKLPEFDREKVRKNTSENPCWIHFGAGNLFRAFHANLAQRMLECGFTDRGVIVAEGYDFEIIERIYRPCDNYAVLVTLKADGAMEKTVVGSVVEACVLDAERTAQFARLQDIFAAQSLQLATFTITEKGYCLTNGKGELLPAVEADYVSGWEKPVSYLGKVVSLLYKRFLSGAYPIALVSTDNCSHNGDRLYRAVRAYAEEWVERGFVEEGFLRYIDDPEQVSFPWTMIDKITPRPDGKVQELLRADGLTQAEPIVTAARTYIAPFVNAEECEYLVIEDAFPNGRPPLHRVGVLFADRETVERAERMKVCTCLNPLHTTLAVFGCLLGYHRISEEMGDEELSRLVRYVGCQEGLPVAEDPGIIRPREFLQAVLQVRLPNPFLPDTPQRIATDTSQKLAIRFGETIRKYHATEKGAGGLEAIPLALAGWLRYLLAVDDAANPMELSPDPRAEELRKKMQAISLGGECREEWIAPVLQDETLFGVNLYEVGLGEKVYQYFKEMAAGVGAVRSTLQKYVFAQKDGAEMR